MSYVNKVILRVQIQSLKCCQSLELLIFVGKGFRSFHTGNIGAAKLLVFKVGGLKKSLPRRPFQPR